MSAPSLLDNPYPGLRPFQADEAHLFFGREEQTTELLRRLQRSRFLAIVGTSGSGKSSLVRAGLLQGLYGGMMPGGSQWRVVDMRPGTQPLDRLAQALDIPGALHDDGLSAEESYTDATLRHSALGLVQAVREARLPPGERVLVLVDQFEELFRGLEADRASQRGNDATAFVNLLLAAAQQQEQPIYVVLTMRSDFLGDCAAFRGLPEAISDGQYLIPRLTREQQRLAITGPAAVQGVSLTPTLVNQLLNDLGGNPDQLPILQHALMRTWDLWAPQPRSAPGTPVIDLPDYERIGGLGQALSLHADEVLAGLGDGEAGQRRRRVATQLFQGLVSTGSGGREVRRFLPLQEAVQITGAPLDEVKAVIEAFRHPRQSFLMPPAHEPLTADSIIDISHESLIRNWQTLRGWLAEEAESARLYERVAGTAALRAQGQAGLWGDPDLAIALAWRQRQRPTAVWAQRYAGNFVEAMDFLDDSLAAAQVEAQHRGYRRRVKAAVVLGLGLVALVVGAQWGISAWDSGVLARQETEATRADLAVLAAVTQGAPAPTSPQPTETDLCSRVQAVLTAAPAAAAPALAARDTRLGQSLEQWCQPGAAAVAPGDLAVAAEVLRHLAAGRLHRANEWMGQLSIEAQLEWTEEAVAAPEADVAAPEAAQAATPVAPELPVAAAASAATPSSEVSVQSVVFEGGAASAPLPRLGEGLWGLLSAASRFHPPHLDKERKALVELWEQRQKAGRAGPLNAPAPEVLQNTAHPVHRTMATKLTVGSRPLNAGESFLIAHYQQIMESRRERQAISESTPQLLLLRYWPKFQAEAAAAQAAASAPGASPARRTVTEEGFANHYTGYAEMVIAAAQQQAFIADLVVEALERFGLYLLVLLSWPAWRLWRLWQQRQGQRIAERPASLRRAIAAVIDLALATALFGAAWYLAWDFMMIGRASFDLDEPVSLTVAIATAVAGLLAGDALRLRHQGSFGKQLCHLRVVPAETGASLRTTLAVSARRNVLLAAAMVPLVLLVFAVDRSQLQVRPEHFLALLAVLWALLALSKEGRTLGDRWSGTRVIDVDSEASRHLDLPPRYLAAARS